jgi:hypothetical protein
MEPLDYTRQIALAELVETLNDIAGYLWNRGQQMDSAAVYHAADLLKERSDYEPPGTY